MGVFVHSLTSFISSEITAFTSTPFSGLTRAKKRAIVTYRESYFDMTSSKMVYPKPSRFLSQFPDDVRLSAYEPVVRAKSVTKFKSRRKKEPSKE